MKIILSILFIILFLILFKNKIEHIFLKQNSEDPLLIKIKNDMIRLDPRVNNISFYSSNESYTEDKNKIYLCLKDNNNNYYDYNMLIYVAIHECSHALTNVIDLEHKTLEFRDKFDYLLTKAYKLGMYNPNKSLVTNYCGINISSIPMQRI